MNPSVTTDEHAPATGSPVGDSRVIRSRRPLIDLSVFVVLAISGSYS
jgi:hypothetical protein